MKKKIAEVEYKVLLNKYLIRRLGCNADHLIHIIRGAVEHLTVDFWDRNIKVARSGQAAEEGFDCTFLPFGLVGRAVYTIEFTPYPRGTVVMTLRNYEDTYPDPQDKDSIYINSDLVNSAPKFTDKQLGPLTQADV